MQHCYRWQEVLQAQAGDEISIIGKTLVSALTQDWAAGNCLVAHRVLSLPLMNGLFCAG